MCSHGRFYFETESPSRDCTSPNRSGGLPSFAARAREKDRLDKADVETLSKQALLLCHAQANQIMPMHCFWIALAAKTPVILLKKQRANTLIR